MELTVTTPSIVFSILSLIYLALTNRFLALAGLIRNLAKEYRSEQKEYVLLEITQLRKRLKLTQLAQQAVFLSLFFGVISILCIFLSLDLSAKILFVLSLFCMLMCLGIAVYEVHLSIGSLEIELSNLEENMA